MASTNGLRASDAERDVVVDRLRTAMVEGRLSAAEFDERVGVALSARTVGELVPVTADLPPGPSRPIAGPAVGAVALGRERDHVPALLRSAFGGWLAIFAACCVVWLLTSGIHHHTAGFWPAWLLVWGLFSLRRSGRSQQHGHGQRQGHGPGADRALGERGQHRHHHAR